MRERASVSHHAHTTRSYIVNRRFAQQLISAFIVAACLAVTGSSQDDVVKLKADLVTVDATVTDKDGNFIRNLKADDFAVYEDGVAQKLDFFEASEQAALTRPLAVVVAIDTSGSIKPEEITRQRLATENFMRLVRPESIFSVIAFNTETRVLQDFTSDPRKVSAAFQKIGEVTGSSRIFGSIYKAGGRL